MDILKARLQNTGLTDSRFKNAAQAIAHLGAVQAQDFSAAKWALGLRVRNATDATIEKAFNDGKILRTHILRPTWHFVLPGDIRWMLDLTAPRVKKILEPYNRKLDLDDALLAKSNQVIVKALRRESELTRHELKAELERSGIRTNVQRLAHIVVWAELNSLICSGPRRGKQFTYALLEERVPKAKRLLREEGMARLALTYFRSHGPAQLKDFSWWSGLPMKEAREALELIKTGLRDVTLQDKTYWFCDQPKRKAPPAPRALLLSIFDEYTIAYRDRSDLSKTGQQDIAKMLSMGSPLTAVIILDGKLAGTWKKKLKKNTIEVDLHPFSKLSEREERALASEVVRYRKFIDAP